ncbi:MAG: muramidase [Candidatus Saccharibacteria bacterium]|nr:muramidase [Candidatus Saccharibacteria bacterium]
MEFDHDFSRRDLLRGAVGLAGLALLSSCGGGPEATPAPTPDPIMELLAISRLDPLVFPDVAWINRQSKNHEPQPHPLIDAHQLREDGMPALAFKATQGHEGERHVDGDLAQNRRNCAEAGILGIAYHYLMPGNAKKQADAFIGALIDTDPDKPGKVKAKHTKAVLVVDVEKTGQDAPHGPSIEDVHTFYDRVSQKTARRLGIYTSVGYWGGYQNGRLLKGELGNPASPKGSFLWWAYYLRSNGTTASGTAGELFKKVSAYSHQKTTDDPWPANRIGDWDYYTIRQFTDNAKYRDYQGAHDSDDKHTLDFNVSWLDQSQLASYGNYRPDELAKVKPLSTKI